jgi:hypothetical protein
VEAIYAASRVAQLYATSRVAQLYAVYAVSIFTTAPERRPPARRVLRFQQKRAGSEIGAPLSANGQPQFWPADRLHMVVACGGHFRGQPRGTLSTIVPLCGTTVEALRGITAWPRGAALRGLSHSMLDVGCWMFDVPRFSGPQPQFWPADRLHMVVACGGHFRGLAARFFFPPGFLSCALLVEKAAKPL